MNKWEPSAWFDWQQGEESQAYLLNTAAAAAAASDGEAAGVKRWNSAALYS